MNMLHKQEMPMPVEQRSWREIGKWFTVHVGRWAVIGGIMYGAGSLLLERSQDVISEPVAEQGALLNTTLEDKSQTIDEVAAVASEVDKQISSITEDWADLKEVLRDEFNIDIDKRPDQSSEDNAQPHPPETTTTVVVTEQ